MLRVVVLSICLLVSLNAKMFQTVQKSEGEFVKKSSDKYYCSNCAMNLPKFYKTNHVHDGVQYCSMHCLSETQDIKDSDSVKVVDVKSLKLIDAKKAFYVVGSKISGTMSVNSKYAFANKSDAADFQKANGGEIVGFDKAYSIAKGDLKKDSKMIQTKREKKVYKHGKKLYTNKCEEIDVTTFKSIASLKVALKDKCKLKKDKQFQMVSVYLWDIKKLKKSERKIVSIKVPEDARCPICGMFSAKYPKWVAMYKSGEKVEYFDGPKDMLKYIVENKQDKFEIFVTDYFTTKKIDGKNAYYVMGSDVYGPMGKELVAFESDEAAYNFKNDHFGKKVLSFEELNEEVLIYLK